MRTNYARQVLAMDDDELERFVTDWMSRKTASYHSTRRFSGPGDMGRDVVGYHTDQRHEGPWDNYQCKQLIARLSEPQALRELAKIFFYSSEGHYSLPARYTFIAPKGVTRTAKQLMDHPGKFKARLLERWDEDCATEIAENKTFPLTKAIERLIRAFDFSVVAACDASQMIDDKDIRAVLVDWFGEDPGEAPPGVVPDDIQAEESPFIAQLVDAYSERCGEKLAGAAGALSHSQFGDHLRRQRTRYFDAAAFRRYYRDNTPAPYMQRFEDDIHHGIIEKHEANYADTLARVDEVLAHAAVVQPSGALAKYARVPVKQGICHHFANEGRLKWKR